MSARINAFIFAWRLTFSFLAHSTERIWICKHFEAQIPNRFDNQNHIRSSPDATTITLNDYISCLFHLFSQMKLVRDIEFPHLQIDCLVHVILILRFIVLVEPMLLLILLDLCDQRWAVIDLQATPKEDARTLAF